MTSYEFLKLLTERFPELMNNIPLNRATQQLVGEHINTWRKELYLAVSKDGLRQEMIKAGKLKDPTQPTQ